MYLSARWDCGLEIFLSRDPMKISMLRQIGVVDLPTASLK
jgi:hypothetical protein